MICERSGFVKAIPHLPRDRHRGSTTWEDLPKTCYRCNICVMAVDKKPGWLLVIFSLPAKSASQRVDIWRKLQKYGTIALPSGGYLLPNSAPNQERMEWLATAIRSYKGQASVLLVQSFDDLSPTRLEQLFTEARSRDYRRLLRDIQKLAALPHSRRSPAQVHRLRRKLSEIVEVDFFENTFRTRVEKALAKLEEPLSEKKVRVRLADYANRTWVTRFRPGIDRVSSAWLIRRFIDPKARFVFGSAPADHPDAIPFDMFSSEGFGHRGEDCTFETLCKEFAIRDGRAKRIAEMIHDADLGDEKFGRIEGIGLDKVLQGWAAQDLSDDALLKRGMELIEGLYDSFE